MKNNNEIMVSIIIPHYNKRDYLKHCLESLFAQKTDFTYEVIVVDNASEDDSVIMVEKEFPAVKIIRMDQNYRFSKACNEGIRIARGQYIALLNNDTEVDPLWLTNLRNALDENQNVGFCASRVYFDDDRVKIDTAGDAYTIAGTAHKIGHLIREPGAFSERKYVFGASASSAIYRRELFEKVGLLDEDLFFGQEDVDFSFRAQLMGYKCLFVPEAIVYHKVSATIGYLSRNYVYLSQRNLEFVFFKNMPIKLLIKYLPVHLIYVVGAFFFSIKKLRLLSYMRGKISFLLHLPNILKKRTQIQRNKTVSDNYIDSIIGKEWFNIKLKKAMS